MLLLPPICVLIVALYPSSSASVSGNQILGSNHISVNDVTNTEPLANHRLPRAISAISLAVRKGVEALYYLLAETKRIKTKTKGFRKYTKSGGYSRAVDDFRGAKPTDVVERTLPNGVRMKFGAVGDRVLILTSRGPDGKPVLDITGKQLMIDDKKLTLQPEMDRIVYDD